MTVKPIIFEKILFGELSPWRNDNSSESKFRDILNYNVRANKDNPGLFFKALKDSFRGYHIDFKIDHLSIIENIASLAKYAELQTYFDILSIPAYFNKASEFYYYLIKNECSRIRIAIAINIENCKTYADSEYQVVSLLKNLDYIIEQLGQRTSTDKLSVYVLNAMKISLFRLYQEIKTVYPSLIGMESLSEYEIINFIAPDFETEKNVHNSVSSLIHRFIESNHSISNVEEMSFPYVKPSDLLYSSFTYIHLNTKPDNIKDLFDSLKNHNLIDKETLYSDFKKIFSGDQVLKPVIWLGNVSEFYYFIKLIHNINKSVIDLKQHQWEVACNCFVMPDGSTFDRLKLKKQKIPLTTAAIIEKIANQLK
jgi:hypothetical protein